MILARRFRCLFFSAFCVCLVCASACRSAPADSSPGSADPRPENTSVKLAVPQNHAYTGAYIDFGETEDDVTLEALERFEKLVGKHQAIVAFSSDWSKNGFPAKQAGIVSNYGAVPLIFWLPWDRVQYGDTKVNRFPLTDILAGAFDSYIDTWAEQARSYGKPLLVAFAIEMNGNWFPWSGIFYGGGKSAGGPLPAGPDLVMKTYRYAIDRVRAKEAANIEWVLHVNNTCDPDEHWNRMSNYYPGKEYVDWLALSAYGQQYPNAGFVTFDQAVPAFYKQLAALDPVSPILLAEWGAGNFPREGTVSTFIAEAFRRFPADFPRLKGAVYWHERWQNGDKSYSNLRINASDEALEEYRKGVANPFWLDRPSFQPR